MSEINPFDPEYVREQIIATYLKRANYRYQMEQSRWFQQPDAVDGPNGEVYWSEEPTALWLDYWMVQIVGRVDSWGQFWTDEQLAKYTASAGPLIGWTAESGFYWERRILFPWLWFDDPTPPTNQDTTTEPVILPAPEPVPLAAKASRGITPQLGLQEDDILYNLSLLVANVLQPLKEQYPNIIVISGFRQVNTGMSQHEKGEAADIQIKNQTDQQLYEVADWIAKNLNFDQLVLHFNDNPRTSWIHVSFSAQSLRYQVLTRDYNDEYHDGLYLIEPLTGEALAAAQREAAATIARIEAELTILQARAKKANPDTVVGDEVRTETTGGDVAEDGAPGVVPNAYGDITAFYNANKDNYDLTTDEGGGRFIEDLVSVLKTIDPQWGHLKKYGAQTQYNGHAVDAIAYMGLPGDPNGVQYNGKTVCAVDVIAGHGAAGAHPAFQVDTPRYEAKDWY